MCRSVKEWTYKELIAGQDDPNFLRSAERVRQLRDYGTEYSDLRGMSVFFRTYSSEYDENRTIWTQEIVLLDLPEALQMRDLMLLERVRLAMKGDVLVRCDCPAFLYWGFAYILSQLDGVSDGQYYGGWSIPGRPPTEPGKYPEDPPGKPPYHISTHRRNWKQLNVMCKHLMFVGQVFPFHANSVTADLTKQGYR